MIAQKKKFCKVPKDFLFNLLFETEGLYYSTNLLAKKLFKLVKELFFDRRSQTFSHRPLSKLAGSRESSAATLDHFALPLHELKEKKIFFLLPFFWP